MMPSMKPAGMPQTGKPAGMPQAQQGMPGKGGGTTPVPMGGNPGMAAAMSGSQGMSQPAQTGLNPQLAALFGSGATTGPRSTGGPTTLPTILPPTRPVIAPPPKPTTAPQTGGTGKPQISPYSMVEVGGHMKPAFMTSLRQQMGPRTGDPSPDELKAFARYRKGQYNSR